MPKKPSFDLTTSNYERAQELKAFDDTKAGVKGLFDTGIKNIPTIFIRPPDELAKDKSYCNNNKQSNFKVPVVNLDGVRGGNKREEIVNQVRIASETWGFFQVVNHGIPLNVLEDMIRGVRKFHEQDLEKKKDWYSRDRSRTVRFFSNIGLYSSRSASWRDTLIISTPASTNLHPNELPQVLRDSTMEYIKNVKKIGKTLFELLSMALGLKPEHLRDMGCAKGYNVACHYSPPCPQPELTLAANKHSDPSFLTILLQDQIGGLQVFHENQWVDVEPIPGSLVINIGDFLQVISNDKFRSVDHRVVANGVGPRISTACFFRGDTFVFNSKPYGPIKQLISEQNPAIFRDFVISEYCSNLLSMEGKSCYSRLDQFKL